MSTGAAAAGATDVDYIQLAKRTSSRALLQVQEALSGAGLRAEPDVLYSTLEDFYRAPPESKRLVVVGCTGAGKSTILNVMAGWKFVQRPPDYEFEWEGKEGAEPLFESAAGDDSVTKKTSFANLQFFGEESRPFVAIDTPGHDDPAGADIDSPEARKALGELAADLHNKLKAIGHVHAVLVLHNDVMSNRLNPATYTMLKVIDEKFKQCGKSVWDNVIVAYSKCNAFDTAWRSKLDHKIGQLQKAIREKVAGCDREVPVITLGGGDLQDEARAPELSAGASAGFERLWRFLETADPIDTSKLQPFEGLDAKWQKMVEAKDEAEARAQAAVIYIAVTIKLALLLGVLFWRHFLLPGWLSAILLNFGGVYDELLILFVFAKWLGPTNVLYSITHFYDVWVRPKLQPHIDKARVLLSQQQPGKPMAPAKEHTE